MQEQRSEISLNELVTVGITLVVVGLIFVYGLDITKDIRDDDPTCPTTFSYNTTAGDCTNSSGDHYTPTNPDWLVANDTMRGLAEVPEKLPTIAIILAVSVIIFVLLRAFKMKG